MPKKQKDPRYATAAFMLRQGGITTFEEIFKVIPRSVVAGDMRTNNNRMKRLVKYPGQWTLEEIREFAGLLNYPFRKLVDLMIGEMS